MAHYTELTADTEQEAMEVLRRCKWIECIGTYENFFDCRRRNPTLTPNYE